MQNFWGGPKFGGGMQPPQFGGGGGGGFGGMFRTFNDPDPTGGVNPGGSWGAGAANAGSGGFSPKDIPSGILGWLKENPELALSALGGVGQWAAGRQQAGVAKDELAFRREMYEDEEAEDERRRQAFGEYFRRYGGGG